MGLWLSYSEKKKGHAASLGRWREMRTEIWKLRDPRKRKRARVFNHRGKPFSC